MVYAKLIPIISLELLYICYQLVNRKWRPLAFSQQPSWQWQRPLQFCTLFPHIGHHVKHVYRYWSFCLRGRRYTDYSKVESTEDKLKPRYVDYFGVDTADDEAADEKLKLRYIEYFGVDTADTGAAAEKLKPRYIEYFGVETADNQGSERISE